MISQLKAGLFVGCAMLAAPGMAFAQTPSPSPAEPPPPAATQPAPGPGQSPLFDPQQLPVERGRVQQFTLTPRGDIDGLILTDGTEVETPPHLSTQIAFSVRPGDDVVIHGLHAAALPLVQAVSIADAATGRTVIDNGPPPPGAGPSPPPPPPPPSPPAAAGAGPGGPIPGLSEVTGRVRMALHGPRGEVNGALLDDGTILRLPPPEADRFASLLRPGQAMVAEGSELVSAIGKVVDVRQIGPSPERLSLVAGPPGPGRHHPPPPPPDPAAAPPGPPRP